VQISTNYFKPHSVWLFAVTSDLELEEAIGQLPNVVPRVLRMILKNPNEPDSFNLSLLQSSIMAQSLSMPWAASPIAHHHQYAQKLLGQSTSPLPSVCNSQYIYTHTYSEFVSSHRTAHLTQLIPSPSRPRLSLLLLRQLPRLPKLQILLLTPLP